MSIIIDDKLDYKFDREDVLKYIIKTIKEKKWKVNEKIYSENQLARMLGVSRSMVREAYVTLEGIGIVETIHGDGTYLRQFEEIDHESPLSLFMMLFNEDIEKLMEFRKVIEVGMVESSIKNIREDQIRLLEKELNNMKENQSHEEISQCDVRIHTLICESVGNPFLSFVYNMITGYLNYISANNWKRILTAGEEESRQELYRQHKAIVVNIANRDIGEATESVREHLNYVNENLNKFSD